MGKPIIHANNSAKRFGGNPEEYLAIHQFIDSSREAFPDLRHRALTHNTWFITKVLPRVFGETIKISTGKEISVTSIGEFHVYEDFDNKFMPSAQDYLAEIEFKDWMDNGKEGFPPSRKKMERLKKVQPKLKPLQKRKSTYRPKQRIDYELLYGCQNSPPGTVD